MAKIYFIGVVIFGLFSPFAVAAPQPGEIITRLAIDEFDRRNFPESARLFEQALEETRGAFGDRHASTVIAYLNLTAAYGQIGNDAQLKAANEKAVLIEANFLQDQYPKTLAFRNSLLEGRLIFIRLLESIVFDPIKLRSGDKLKETIADLEKWVPRLQSGFDADSSARTYGKTLASSYGEIGRKKEQIALLINIKLSEEKSLAADDPERVKTLILLADAYGSLGLVREQIETLEPTVRSRIRATSPKKRDRESLQLQCLGSQRRTATLTDFEINFLCWKKPLSKVGQNWAIIIFKQTLYWRTLLRSMEGWVARSNNIY